MRLLAAIVSSAFLLAACGGTDPGSDVADPDGASNADVIDAGRELYEQTCATCHGSGLEGSDTGPPFLDPIYAPNHHSDESFYNAVANGVQPHHWDFGPMPPQPSVTTEDVGAIIAYVRSEQEKAGITEDPSHP